MLKFCGIIGISKIEFFEFSGAEMVKVGLEFVESNFEFFTFLIIMYIFTLNFMNSSAILSTTFDNELVTNLMLSISFTL